MQNVKWIEQVYKYLQYINSIASDSKCFRGEIQGETTTDQTICAESFAPGFIVRYESFFVGFFT